MTLPVGTVVRDPWTGAVLSVEERARTEEGHRAYLLLRYPRNSKFRADVAEYVRIIASEVESWEVVEPGNP